MENREIKFRAWDKKRNIMIGEDYPYNWDDKKEEFWGDSNEIKLTSIQYIHNCILMQYTGLKDKNGKEIYEGDIVNGELVEFLYNFGEWDNCFGYYLPEKESDREIIGNVFENPELIKN